MVSLGYVEDAKRRQLQWLRESEVKSATSEQIVARGRAWRASPDAHGRVGDQRHGHLLSGPRGSGSHCVENVEDAYSIPGHGDTMDVVGAGVGGVVVVAGGQCEKGTPAPMSTDNPCSDTAKKKSVYEGMPCRDGTRSQRAADD